jgi:hypothetical protein
MSSTPTANVSLPPPTADLATTWSFLEEGVDHIMTKLQTGVSYSKYMSLYTVAYNYCTSSKMHGSATDPAAMANRSTFSPSLPQPPVVTGPATPPNPSGRESDGLGFIQQSDSILCHTPQDSPRCQLLFMP